MLAQAAFPVFLHVVGCLLSTPFMRTTDTAFAWLSGIFWGLALWVIWAVIVLSIGIPFTAGVMFGGIAVLAVWMMCLHIRRKLFDRSDLPWFLLSTTMVATAAGLAANFNFTAASFDSFTQILLGKELAHYHGFDPAVHPALASWGVFTPVVQAAAVFLKVDYLSAVWPAMGAAFLCCFLPVCIRVAVLAGAPGWFAVPSACIGAALLAATYLFTFQCFYIHNNLPSAIYLLFAVATLWLALQTGQRAWLVFSTAAFFAFTLLRTEAPLFVVVFMAPVWCATDLDRRTRLRCMLPLTLATLAWYARLLALIGGGTDILSPTKAVALMGLLAAAALVAALPDREWRRRLAQAGPWLMMIATALVMIAAFWRDHQLMQDSFEAIAENLLYRGGWGRTWACILALLAASIALPRIPRQEVWTVGLAVFWMLLLTLAIFRENPYRTGWGDSANRLMTQSLPIALLYLIARFGVAIRVAALDAPLLRRSMARGVGALLVVVLAAAAIMPLRVDRRVKVLESSPMHEDHDFRVAFLKADNGEYVAAVNPGPATVVLDLGRMRSADRLEMVEYDPSQGWTDFAWQVSTDGLDWTHVFDTRTSSARSRLRIDETTSRFRLTGQGNFRYLKLTFRESKGQNRLLLRRLRIYALPIYSFSRWRAEWKK